MNHLLGGGCGSGEFEARRQDLSDFGADAVGCEEEAGHGFVGSCRGDMCGGGSGGGVFPRVGGLLLGW